MGQLFDAKAPFIVDPYQRDYAWTYKPRPNEDTDDGEVADFVYDVKRVVDETIAEPAAASQYFFGLIVAAEQPNIGWIPDEKHEIVDGQQRLTTFVLLASAMNEVAQSIQQDAQRLGDAATAKRCRNFQDILTERCIERRLKSTAGLDPQLFDVLTLTEGDNPFFQKLIRGKPPGDPPRDSCILLAGARRALVGSVEEWLPPGSPSDRAQSLTEIRNIIFDQAEVIQITAKNTVDAYRLFAVANNRGKKLEQADLLRAYCLRLVSQASDGTISKDVALGWAALDSRKPDKANAALRAYYGSVMGQRAPKVDVYDAYARDVFKQSEYEILDGDEAEAMRSQVGAIRLAADLYDKLVTGTWPYDPPSQVVSDWQRHLLRRVVIGLKSVRAVPLLLAAATEWADDEKQFAKLMQFIEKAEFRFLVSSSHQSTVGDKYLEAAVKVRGGGSPDDVIDFLEPWVAFLAGDDAFKVGLSSLTYVRSGPRIRHLLAMLDDHWPAYRRWKKSGVMKVKANELRNWNLGSTDIDHVYPQGETSDAKLLEMRHRLGNLTLLLDSDNRVEAKMHLPTSDKKIDIYKSSLVRLTERLGKQLETMRSWTTTDVEKRQNDLIEMAEFVYQLSSEAKKAAEQFESRTRRRAAKSEVRAEPAVWWFTYGKESPYTDVPGQEYQFGQRLRAGKKVQTGDFAIEYRRVYGTTGRKRLWEKDEIIGIGRIGRVDEIVGAKKTENRRAVFAQHHTFNPPILIEDMGVADSRDQTQNSIKDGTEAEFDSLVAAAGLPDRESLPPIEQIDVSVTASPNGERDS